MVIVYTTGRSVAIGKQELQPLAAKLLPCAAENLSLVVRFRLREPPSFTHALQKQRYTSQYVDAAE
jgi:hypothetical protein